MEMNAEDLYTEVLKFFSYDQFTRSDSAFVEEENNEDTIECSDSVTSYSTTVEGDSLHSGKGK